MTPEEAKARLKRLAHDPGWNARFNNRDTAALDEFDKLKGIVIAGAVAESVKPKASPEDIERAPYAREQIAEWKNDREFRQKVISGDKTAVRLWNDTVEISGADK